MTSGRKDPPRGSAAGEAAADVAADVESASSSSTGTGTSPTPLAVRVLQERSRLAQALQDVPRFANVLIVEDEQRDGDRLVSTLRSIFGYDLKVRQCRTLGTALDAVLADPPDLVFLDDRLGTVDRVERSVPFLRTAQCEAVIIVISAHIDRRRRAAMLKLDIGGAIDKDELDSTSIRQVLLEAHSRAQATPKRESGAQPGGARAPTGPRRHSP